MQTRRDRRDETFETEADQRPCSPGAKLAVALAQELAIAARAIGRDQADELAGSTLCPTREKNLRLLRRKARCCVESLAHWIDGREVPLPVWMEALGLLELDADEIDPPDGDEGHAG